jgi:Right handed beta helix region
MFLERLTQARTRLAVAGVLAATTVALAVSPASATQPECVAVNESKDVGYNGNTVANPLGAAIAEADAGNTLKVLGTCHGNFLITKDLALRGRPWGLHTDTIDGDLRGAVLTIPSGKAANLTITDLTITGGSGAGIAWHDGVVTIRNTHVTNNAGTGIGRFGGGGAVIENSVVSGNSAASGAGIWNSIGGSPMMISNSLVTNNRATFFGGGLFNRGRLAISDSTISNNVAGTSGGGIYNLHGVTIDLTNVTLSGNSPDDYFCASFCP